MVALHSLQMEELVQGLLAATQLLRDGGRLVGMSSSIK